MNHASLQVDISSVEQFEALRQQEQQYFLDMVQQCKDSGATLVICQWGEAAAAFEWVVLRSMANPQGQQAGSCHM